MEKRILKYCFSVIFSFLAFFSIFYSFPFIVNAQENNDDLDLINSGLEEEGVLTVGMEADRKSTRLNSSHVAISYAVFCLKKKKQLITERDFKRDKEEMIEALTPVSDDLDIVGLHKLIEKDEYYHC